jgi:DNA-binding NtrC family response regulator
MGVLMQTPAMEQEGRPRTDLRLQIHEASRILIVCERDADTDQLKGVFRQAGLAAESTDNMAAGCELARSGRFGVVFSTTHSAEGSWTRLIAVASRHRLAFEIVLLARDFDLNQWGEAMQLGAFDVLDVLRDLPDAAEVAQHALSAAYLRRFRPACESARC